VTTIAKSKKLHHGNTENHGDDTEKDKIKTK